MADIKGIAHFSIPVSDVEKSTKFYTEIVGCKFLSARPDKKITFLDAGGVCVLLIKRPAPINRAPLEGSDGVHHAFMILLPNTNQRWRCCAQGVSRFSSRRTDAEG